MNGRQFSYEEAAVIPFFFASCFVVFYSGYLGWFLTLQYW
jgi:hypothetical protein